MQYYKQMVERQREHTHCLEIAYKRKLVEMQRKMDELRYQKMRDAEKVRKLSQYAA